MLLAEAVTLSVILAWRLQSQLDILAASSSLSSLCADGFDTVSAMRQPVKGFSGWSRPMLPVHADLAPDLRQRSRRSTTFPLLPYAGTDGSIAALTVSAIR